MLSRAYAELHIMSFKQRLFPANTCRVERSRTDMCVPVCDAAHAAMSISNRVAGLLSVLCLAMISRVSVYAFVDLPLRS